MSKSYIYLVDGFSDLEQCQDPDVPIFQGVPRLVIDYIDGKPVSIQVPADILVIQNKQPSLDDWINWDGGPCPVEPGTIVDIRYRDEDEKLACDPPAECWEHSDPTDYSDIIAYRECKGATS